MESLLSFIYLLSLVTWIGGLALLFLVVSPSIYRVLSDELAHTLDYHIHSSFSMIAPACGVGALVSLIALALAGAPVGWLWARLGLLVVMILIALNASWSLQPRTLTSAPGAEEQVHVDERRQRLGGQLNGLVLLLGLIVLWLSVGGPRI